jgi:hypothetical protein
MIGSGHEDSLLHGMINRALSPEPGITNRFLINERYRGVAPATKFAQFTKNQNKNETKIAGPNWT